MIKNILYSLFLHAILLSLIYINFKIVKNEIIEIDRGISVGIMALKSEKEAVKTVKTEEKIKKEAKTKEISKKKVEKIKKKAENKKKTIAKKKEEKQAEVLKPKEEKRPDLKKTEEEKQEEIKKEEKSEEKEDSKEEKEEEKIEEKKAEEETLPKEENKQKFYESEEIIDDVESLNLSAREKFNIKTQLSACFSRAMKDKKENDITIVVQVQIKEDGTIDYDFEKNFDVARYENAKETKYKAAVNSVIYSLELCSPLRNLPADKYDIWHEFSIKFN